ncbi:hypothetical protein B0H17DRAFT_1183205 [Mycena rosella]|uniref:Uncharacterized protein n=1 Tax=Mycena rosella TaxID=1033263 RepID=A0AAD7D0Y0_MYCRO|nr:hypothetical protein B0H17DRAFT_1183205 [Mycena rosella]
MLFRLSSTFTHLVLYTLYLILFIFSIHTLAHRSPAGRRFLLVTTSAMFLLGTAAAVISVVETGTIVQLNKELFLRSTDLPRQNSLIRLCSHLNLAEDVLLETRNFLADLIFLYRCYIMWGSDKRIVILPGIFMVATVVVGCISAIGWDTLGRIWYIRHEAYIVNGTTFRKRYDTAIAMILESGSIYCVGIILWIISRSLPNQSDSSTQIFTGFTEGLVEQGVNIVPTLILVRVGMGHLQWQKNPAPRSQTRLASERSTLRWAPVIPPTDASHEVIDLK